MIRERWAAMCNAALQYAGHKARVDHRTLEAQRIDREPTQHLGPTATAIDRRAQRSIDPNAPRPDPSRKLQDFETQVAQRLVAAKEAGELERRAQALDDAILDTSSDLAASREERDQHQVRQYAEVIARGLSPASRRAVIQHGVSVMDQRDGTYWLTAHEADGVVRRIARGGAEQRYLAERVAEALPAAVRQIESEQAARKKRAESEHREREQTAHGERVGHDDARAQGQTGAGRDHGQREYRREPPPTPQEFAAVRVALDEYARRHQLRIDTVDGVRTASNGLRDEWVTAGTGTQRQYMALRQVRREAERAARARIRHAGRDGAQDRISGAGSTHGYRSAELAAARALGLRYNWDATARVRRYRDRAGTELFITTRRIIEMVQHNEAAEVAALRIAAAKWGDQISIQGSSEFRERMARLSARQGIGVEDTDLHALVADENARIARGESPGGAERERQAAQDRAQAAQDELEDDDDERDQDLGR